MGNGKHSGKKHNKSATVLLGGTMHRQPQAKFPAPTQSTGQLVRSGCQHDFFA